ncbi:MAG: glycosyltransferase family 2 protein [Selenomonadaceae bacterium]|nr:glycosyltransferase family 2 protein [Selenomonadaceae bacterium]
MKLPAISVIIPLYNVDKYVGECLDSLLAQTFQDFEVIVVDDCSTDNSVAVVKNYASKFGGRLKLYHMAKNSGGAGLPRNKGIKLARGEYIYCLDPDDTITSTALEKMYFVAKDFNADVVASENCYYIPENLWDNVAFRKQLKPFSGRGGQYVTKLTLITEDIYERATMFYQGLFVFGAPLKMFRRDFLIKNEINFLDCFAEDVIFTICVLCSAKRYVLSPDAFYNYRIREGSAVNSQREVSNLLHRQIKALKSGIKYLDEFFSGRVTFSQRTDLKYIFFEAFSNELLGYLTAIYSQVPIHELDRLLQKEFSDGDNVAVTAFIFNMMNRYRLSFEKNLRQAAELEKINQQNQAYISELEKFVAQLLPKE